MNQICDSTLIIAFLPCHMFLFKIKTDKGFGDKEDKGEEGDYSKIKDK